MERKYKTKDQKKIEKLTVKLAETEAELSKVKKDRKRLNYAVDRLENEKAKAKDKSSSNDIQKIKELNAQIKQLEQSIEEKEEEYGKKVKRLLEERQIAERNCNYYKDKMNTAREQVRSELESEYNGMLNNVIRAIANTRKGKPKSNPNISRYEDGKRYFIERKDNEEHEIPIFSIENLFIQIHPKTGLPLSDIHFKLFKEWAYLNLDYLQFYSPYEEYINKNKMRMEFNTRVEAAYIVGKKLLPFYEHLLF